MVAEFTQVMYERLSDYQASIEKRRDIDLREAERHRRSKEQVMSMFGSINEQLALMRRSMDRQRSVDVLERQGMERRLQGISEATVRCQSSP